MSVLSYFIYSVRLCRLCSIASLFCHFVSIFLPSTPALPCLFPWQPLLSNTFLAFFSHFQPSLHPGLQEKDGGKLALSPTSAWHKDTYLFVTRFVVKTGYCPSAATESNFKQFHIFFSFKTVDIINAKLMPLNSPRVKGVLMVCLRILKHFRDSMWTEWINRHRARIKARQAVFSLRKPTVSSFHQQCINQIHFIFQTFHPLSLSCPSPPLSPGLVSFIRLPQSSSHEGSLQ